MSHRGRMFEYAGRVSRLAMTICEEELTRGEPRVDAAAMASAACIEVSLRIAFSVCGAFDRAAYLQAVGEHYDLVAADEKWRSEAAN